VQTLSIPVIRHERETLITDVRIEYTTPWQRTHWRTIETAYNSSPFYLYYKDALQPFYERQYDTLFEFNLGLIRTILKLLRIGTDIQLTTDYCQTADPDLRTLIHPKRAVKSDYPLRLTSPYYQVFEDRFGFTPNLSVIDLIFNLGPEAGQYLQTLYPTFHQIPPENER
jgi:hypothetical protein